MTGDEACIMPARGLEVIDGGFPEPDLFRLGFPPDDNSDREQLARAYLARHCDELIEWRIPRTRRQSHSCVVEGTSPARIVIGAHYDKVRRGDGIVDNWTGVILMGRLVATFVDSAPRHTLEFVMFGEEEPGMHGSRAFLRQHPAIDDIGVMVNLDTFGTGPVTIDRRSDNDLECLALRIGRMLAIETRTSYLRESTGDWEPFADRDIPVLNLNSLDRAGLRLIHSPRDRVEAVDLERLQEAWRLVLNVVVNLDRRD